MNAPDYETFCENVLIASADAQSGTSVKAINIEALCQERGWEVAPTWRQTVVGTLVERGYGSDWSTFGARQFYIRGPGLAAAEQARRARTPQTLQTKVAAVPRSDWIALGAFITSIVALFK